MVKLALSSAVAIASCLLVLILTCCKSNQSPPLAVPPLEESPPTPTIADTGIGGTGTAEGRSGRSLWSAEEQAEIVTSIQQKLTPHQLVLNDQPSSSGNSTTTTTTTSTNTLKPHQFLHLHHMKTGGTSMDHLIKCAMSRLRTDYNYTVPYFNIHECARGKFRRCVANNDDPCRKSMNESAIMSYCAALNHLDAFGWDEQSGVAALTVLRNPIDRVWSMFRFEPRMCYYCKNLTDIYDLIDRNETLGFDGLCLNQLQNHEVANMLTSDWPDDANEDDLVAEAIENMKSFFTVIGLTEELPATAQLLGQVFPWLNMTIEGSKTFCQLPHDNSSPTNNHCIKHPNAKGKGFTTTHWDLPSHPDEETRQAIIAHNQLDIKLYEAAVEYFQLQMRAMNMGEQS